MKRASKSSFKASIHEFKLDGDAILFYFNLQITGV